jgi:quinol monooxygenase YgiN
MLTDNPQRRQSMASGAIRLIVRQGIMPGKLDEFKNLADELTCGVEENEPTTLGYEWFIDEAGSSCYLNEYYGSSEDFLLHFSALGPKLEAMLAVSPLQEMIVLGEPNEQIKEMLGGLGAKFYTPTVGFCR